MKMSKILCDRCKNSLSGSEEWLSSCRSRTWCRCRWRGGGRRPRREPGRRCGWGRCPSLSLSWRSPHWSQASSLHPLWSLSLIEKTFQDNILQLFLKKNLQFPPAFGPLGLSKSYGLVASSPKSSTIISRDKLMAVSTELSTARLDTSLFFLPQDSKFSLPYVHTAWGGDFRIW